MQTFCGSTAAEIMAMQNLWLETYDLRGTPEWDLMIAKAKHRKKRERLTEIRNEMKKLNAEISRLGKELKE